MRQIGALLQASALIAAGGCGPSNTPSENTTPAPTAQGYEAYVPMAAVPGAGSIRGLVTLAGPVPKLQPRPVTTDKAACGAANVSNPSLVMGPGSALRNAVVRLVDIRTGKEFPAGAHLLDQKRCAFVPYVQIVPLGRPLGLLNSDPVNHNVHAYDAENTSLFNLGMPLQGVRMEETLPRAGPVRIKCDAHAWMSAWVYVSETPYAALTGPDGRYRLSDVPPGSYRLAVWHELLGEREVPVKVSSGQEAEVDVPLSLLGSANPRQTH